MSFKVQSVLVFSWFREGGDTGGFFFFFFLLLLVKLGSLVN